ncbi:hypothetical protein QC761_607970 [Podospora bellae-mahoneyi]|uniref:Zinc finger PHD-type domain-containing protein n=1 Tax=Podospora bellae-mahoneyi TaxID=2093777 RepID=A0ABR0FCU7_9PEZI|nr:hypothetical protein QC761_607970 [Podospora bellae-mahoneyi]
MVACDGAECQREWFHLECVGLEHEPKGSGKLISSFNLHTGYLGKRRANHNKQRNGIVMNARSDGGYVDFYTVECT